MKLISYLRSLLSASVGFAFLLFIVVGCGSPEKKALEGGEDKVEAAAEEEAGEEHPSGEHPSGEHPSGDSSEHPSGEHPSGEHPNNDNDSTATEGEHPEGGDSDS